MNNMKKPSARTRVTISIKQDILTKVDSLIDGLTIRSRSQAFEFLLTKILGEKLNVALVLAGGKPKNITIGNTTKFLAKIGTKTLLETVLEHLHGLGINKFIVYVDYKADDIIRHFNSLSLSYSVRFITGKRATGTAEPLLKAKPFLKDTFLLAYGDTICRLNLSNMYAFHKNNSSIATVALTSAENPKKYGVAIVEGAKIRSFAEKPKENLGSYFINAGYFIFEPEIFAYINKTDKSLEKDILPRLAQQGLLFAYPFQGLYLNINTRADLEKARTLLQD
jgi:mannose-1-phosphate guanylyltransferase